MKDLYNNKKVIIICSGLILLTLLVYLYFNKSDSFEEYEGNSIEYLKKYSSNEYIPVYVTEEDMVRKYLNDYKNNMIYDVTAAYESLNSEYRRKKFTDLNGYKEYVNKTLSLSTLSMEVEKYSVTIINGHKFYNIYDTSDNQYIFKEYSIMNYEVFLDDYSVELK